MDALVGGLAWQEFNALTLCYLILRTSSKLTCTTKTIVGLSPILHSPRTTPIIPHLPSQVYDSLEKADIP